MSKSVRVGLNVHCSSKFSDRRSASHDVVVSAVLRQASASADVKMAVVRWYQLRFDFDGRSTASQRSLGHSGVTR